VRILLLAMIASGCSSGSDIDAPDDCAAGELHIVHDTVDERVMISSYGFVNKLNDASPGTLDIGGASMTVHVEFEKLAANGDTVDARGSVVLNGLDVGNCETGGLPSLLFVDDGAWRFELRELTMTPYCGDAFVAEPLSGCYRAR
jgi:hypothetical protein